MKNLFKAMLLTGALLMPLQANAQEPKTFISVGAGADKGFQNNSTMAKVKLGIGLYPFNERTKLEASLSYNLGSGSSPGIFIEAYQADLLFHHLFPISKDGPNIRIGAGLTLTNLVESQEGSSAKVLSDSFAFGPTIATGAEIPLDKKNSFYIELLNNFALLRNNTKYDIYGFSVDAGFNFRQ